jgi:hypothetical protein
MVFGSELTTYAAFETPESLGYACVVSVYMMLTPPRMSKVLTQVKKDR